MFEALTSVRTAEQRMERSSNFELFSWLFMRVSGIVLLIIALAHLINDYFRGGVRVTLKILLYLLYFALMLMGSYVIFTFRV